MVYVLVCRCLHLNLYQKFYNKSFVILTFHLGLAIASLFYEEETVLQVSLASFYPVLLMSGKLIYLN